jgi:hypothetical protein
MYVFSQELAFILVSNVHRTKFGLFSFSTGSEGAYLLYYRELVHTAPAPQIAQCVFNECLLQ